MKKELMQAKHVAALLYSYPLITKELEIIEDSVKNKAHKAAYSIAPCENLCNEIINITDKGESLLIIKNTMDQVLSRMDADELLYLRFKFFGEKGLKDEIGYDPYNRSYYRRQARILGKFIMYCGFRGLDDVWFEEQAEKCPILRSTLTQLLIRKYEADERAKREAAKLKKMGQTV